MHLQSEKKWFRGIPGRWNNISLCWWGNRAGVAPFCCSTCCCPSTSEAHAAHSNADTQARVSSLCYLKYYILASYTEKRSSLTHCPPGRYQSQQVYLWAGLFVLVKLLHSHGTAWESDFPQSQPWQFTAGLVGHPRAGFGHLILHAGDLGFWKCSLDVARRLVKLMKHPMISAFFTALQSCMPGPVHAEQCFIIIMLAWNKWAVWVSKASVLNNIILRSQSTWNAVCI